MAIKKKKKEFKAAKRRRISLQERSIKSSALLFTDAVRLTGAHLFCHVACFSLPPFHVYAAAMIINRNIKASGAILVCDNPHTPSIHHPNLLLPWQRWLRNYVSPSCRYRVSLHVNSCLQWRCDMLTIISAFQLLYKKGVPSREKQRESITKPSDTHTPTHTYMQSQ